MLSMSTLEVLVDAVAPSEHGILIRCDIGAKLVDNPNLNAYCVELQLESIHLLIQYKIKQWL
jgi:hypothetical protein